MMFRVIGYEQVTVALGRQHIPTTLPYRAIATCGHFFSDKQREDSQSLKRHQVAKARRSENKHKRSQKPFVKSYSLTKPIGRLSLGAQEVFERLKKGIAFSAIWKFQKPFCCRRETITSEQTEQTHAMFDDPKYEKAFKEALEAFNEHETKRDTAKFDDPKYERTFNEALEAFNEYQTDQEQAKFEIPKYEKALDALNEHQILNIQRVCQVIQEMDEATIIAETNTITKAFDLEKTIESVIDSTLVSASKQNHDTLVQRGLQKWFSYYFSSFIAKYFINSFFPFTETVRKWKRVHRREKKGMKTYYGILNGLFSQEEKTILKHMIAEEFKEQFKRRSGNKQNVKELLQTIVKRVMIKILLSQLIKDKLSRLSALAKDSKNQKEMLNIFLRLFIQFFIFPEIYELWRSWSSIWNN